MEDYQLGGEGGEWGEKVQGLSINGSCKIDRGKKSIGNGEAKELISMT